MSEIIYRIPSAIPYAYVEVHVKDVSELPDPAMLAAQYAAYYDAYSKEEKAAIQRALSAPQAPSQTDPETRAQQLLNEGLGGVTELHDEAEEYKNNSDKAPWDKPQVDAKPKPWETEGW